VKGHVDGHDSLRALEGDIGPLPSSPIDQRGEGRGEHRYFRHPGGDLPGRKLLDLGLELLSDGQLVIAPPGLHVSGERRTWVDGWPRREDLAPLPREWVAWIVSRDARTQLQPRWERCR